jgi:hypothetical protein
MNRRSFMKMGLRGIIAAPAGIALYGLGEASVIRVVEQTIAVRNLPKAFEGKRLALLADLHAHWHNPMSFVREIVEKTNSLNPDLVAIAGDIVHRGTKYITPVMNELSRLRAPLGIFAVPGNHDMTDAGKPVRRGLRDAGLFDVTNSHFRVENGSDRICLAGLDDLWWGKPDVEKALRGVDKSECVIMLCHNPDFAETMKEDRVSLMLSGHLHGGQMYLPVIGAPWIPSRFGEKYLAGLVAAPTTKVFISRGLGVGSVPFRFQAIPEICLLTLQCETSKTA